MSFDVSSTTLPASLCAQVDSEDLPLGYSKPTVEAISDILPPYLEEIMVQAQTVLGLRMEYSLAAMLGNASVAIGRTRHSRWRGEFNNYCQGWFAAVGSPAMGKTPALRKFSRYVVRKQGELCRQYENEIDLYIAEQNKSIRKPTLGRVKLSDLTIEKLAMAVKENPRGLIILPNELDGWLRSFDKYNGGGSDKAAWIDVWDGLPIDKARVSGDIITEGSFVTILGGIQPKVLSKSISFSDGSGFSDRFLFFYPAKKEVLRASDEEEWDAALDARWDRVMDRLFSLSVEDEPLTYTDQAAIALRAFVLATDEKKQDGLDADDDSEGIYGKAQIYVHRFALLLHLIDWACGFSESPPAMQIDYSPVQRAIKLCWYCVSTYLRIIAECSAGPLDRLCEWKREYYADLRSPFSAHEAHNLCLAHGLDRQWRTIQRWFGDKIYFEQSAHGLYSKKFA